MANSAYKGLEIEIGANTTDAARALRNLDKQVQGTTKEMRQLSNALKVDPTNANLIAQQQDVLSRKLENATEKLKIYKKLEAQRPANMSDQQWTQLQADIARTTQEIEKYQREIKRLEVAPEFEKAKKAVRETKEELVLLDRALQLDPKNVELTAQKTDALKRGIAAAEEEVKQLRNIQQQLGKDELGTKEWAQLELEIAEAENAIKEYSRELDVVNGKSVTAARTAGEQWQKAGDAVQNVSQNVSNVGDKLTRTVTAGMAIGAAAVIKSYKDIDDALTDVRKTVDGTEEDYQQLRKAAVEYSETNAVSADQILSIEALGAQLGFTIDELEQFGEVVSGLDIATNMDAETAATEMAHFANIMGMAHDEIDNYASTIVGLGNSTATTESDISAMAQRIAGAGKNIGLSSADVLGLAAALSSLGLEAEAGGTAIFTIMSNIDKAVGTGSDKLDVWAEAAKMSAEEFAAAWKNDPVKALEAVLTGIQANVENGGNLSALLDDLGISSIRQTDLMKRLANSGDLMANTVAKANEEWEANTALTKEVENRNNSLSSKFEILKNRVISVAQEVGEPLANALLKAIDAAEPLFDAIKKGADAFASMSEQEQQAIITAGAHFAALGPLLSIVGRLGTGVGSAMKAYGGLTEEIAGLAKGASAATPILTGLKGGLVGVALAAVGVSAAITIDWWMKWQKEIENTTKAHRTLAELEEEVAEKTGNLDGIVADAEGRIMTYGHSVEETTQYIKELNEKAAQTGDAFVDAMADANKGAAMADVYAKAIENLTEKGELNEEEQARLKRAVEGYNEVTGSSISVIDEQTGKISVSTEELNKNTEAWKENAKAEAYKKYAAEMMENMIDAEMRQADAVEAAKKAHEDYEKVLAEVGSTTSMSAEMTDYMNEKLLDAELKAKQADENVEELNKEVEDFGKQSELAGQKADEITAKLEAERKAAQDLENRFSDLAAGVVNSMDDCDMSVDEFKQKLKEAGFSVETLNQITDEQFYEMWESCNGDVTLMIQKLIELNNTKIEPQKLAVDDSDVDTALAKLRELAYRASAVITQRVQTVFSSVGEMFRNNAAGGHIPTHADGGSLNGILTRPTLTNVGWIGEAGAEATYHDSYGAHIIPLTNDKYADVFASKVAEHMSGGGTTVNNFYLDDWILNDEPVIEEKALDLMEEIARKGGMNRG